MEVGAIRRIGTEQRAQGADGLVQLLRLDGAFLAGSGGLPGGVVGGFGDHVQSVVDG